MLSTPSFSAHGYALEVLSRHLPTTRLAMPIDVDTSLAGLDAAESELRNLLGAARTAEDDARDGLSRALHQSSRVKESVSGEADRAESTVEDAISTGRDAAQALTALIAPLRAAKEKRECFVAGHDLLSVLSGSGAVDVVRAAKLLKQALDLVNSPKASQVIFDGHTNACENARAQIAASTQDLVKFIEQRASQAVIEVDTNTLKGCFDAAAELGKGHCDNVETVAINVLVASARSGAVRTSRESERSSPGTAQLLSSLGVDIGVPDAKEGQRGDRAIRRVFEELEAARPAVVSLTQDFASRAACVFPDPDAAVLRLVNTLMQQHVYDQALRVLEDADIEVSEASASEQETPTANEATADATVKTDSSVGSAPGSTAEMARARQRQRRRLASRKRAYLNTLVTVFNLVGQCEVAIYRTCTSAGLAEDRLDELFAQSRSALQQRLDEYPSRETEWMESQLSVAYADMGRLEKSRTSGTNAPRAPPSSVDAYYRYRVLYLHVAGRFPQMTARAAQVCLQSLRRSAIIVAPLVALEAEAGDDGPASALRSLRSGASSVLRDGGDGRRAHTRSSLRSGDDSAKQYISTPWKLPPPDATELKTSSYDWKRHKQQAPGSVPDISTMETICHVLLKFYHSQAELLIQQASNLLPAVDGSETNHVELWSGATSPLASYSKAVQYLFDANSALDAFLQSLEAAEDKTSVDLVPDVSIAADLDDTLGQILSAERRSALRFVLRRNTDELSSVAQAGLENAVKAAGERLRSFIDIDQTSSASVDAGFSGIPLDSNDEDGPWSCDAVPSMSFVTAAAFLEQLLSAFRGALSGRNLELCTGLLARTAYEIVLQEWCKYPSTIVEYGGMQLSADGSALANVFSRETTRRPIDRLPCIGRIFICPAPELPRELESEPLARIPADALLQLVRKRPDADHHDIVSLCRALQASNVLTDDGRSRNPPTR